MGIFRTNNPSLYDEVDGIIIDESAPPPSVRGVGTGIAILVGQFQRGPLTMESIGSAGQLFELYGRSYTYKGNIALMNKKFASLKIIRAAAAAAAKASLTIDDGAGTPTDIITFTAKYVGAYGNSITVTVEDGTTEGKKYTIADGSTDAVLLPEIYDDVVITAVGTTFSESKLVDVTVLATSAEPEDTAATALESGSDGTIADTDYQTAIALAEVEGAGNILFLDDYNSTRNGYLKTHAAAVEDKVVVMAGSETETAAQSITAVATLRDTQGRCIYAANWIETTINGTATFTSPASWLASILSQTHPSVDPAYAANAQFMAGANRVKKSYTRTEFINMNKAGVCAFEYDADIGIKPKSGVVTQIADSSKLMIFRRRMADYLTASVATFLKTYQNAPNTANMRRDVGAAILGFVESQERLGVLPKDAEVNTGLAKLVDVETLNTDDTIAAGFFYILWKQRIYSSARFIVIKAQIGESVVVTEV